MQPSLLFGLLLTCSPALALGGAHGPMPLPPPAPPGPPPMAPPTAGPATGGREGGSAGGQPGSAGTPSGGAGAVPTGGAAPSGPTGPATGTQNRPAGGNVATGAEVDITTWEYWWLYNKDAYVDLKQHIEASAISSGSDADAQSALQWDRVGEQVLPELLRALESTDDHDQTLASLIALARLCDGSSRARAGEIAAACAQRETAGNRFVAEGAVVALGIVGHEPSVFELCALMRDQPDARTKLGGRAVQSRTRAFAALSLGLLGARTENEDARRYAVHHLVRQLADCATEQPDLQAACAIAIGMIPLSTYAEREPAAAAAGSARATPANARRENGLASLFALLGDPRAPTFVRAHLPRAIANLSATGAWRENAARALLARLADRSERNEVVLGSVLALGALADASTNPFDRDVRAALVRQIDAPDPQARCFAVIALGQIAGRGEGPAVDEVRALLARNLTTKSTRERCWSALALGVLEHARAKSGGLSAASTQALRRALQDARAPEEVGAASIACGLAGIQAATPLLLQRLGEAKEARAQGYVALALGLLGAREALEPLRKLLDESRLCSEKLPQTATALALLEDPLLVSRLVGLLGRGTSQSTLDAACFALASVGDRRAVEPLLTLVHDTQATAHTRAAAIGALGRVCDRDRLPWQHAVSVGLNYRAMTVTLSDGQHGGLLDLL